MALRVGAILLASANFLSATLIGESGYKVVYGVKTVRGDRPEPTPVPGVIVKDYVIGDEHCKGRLDGSC